MRVLLAGGAGFAGTGFTKLLKEHGHEVTVLDIIAPLHQRGYPSADRYLWKGLVDIEPSDVEGHDVVINFAAQADVPMGFSSPRWTVQENTEGAVALLEAVRKVGVSLVVHASTGNVYGRPIYLPIDEDHPPVPHNPYSASKIAQEMLFWAWHRSYQVPIAVMSNGVVIGPEMRREIFIYKWLRALELDEPLIIEGGAQTRDVTYSSDVLDAWLKLITAPREKVVGEKFQVSYGEEQPVWRLLQFCLEATGIKLDGEYDLLAHLHSGRDMRIGGRWVSFRGYRPGEEGQRECFDCSKAAEVLGYQGKIAPREAIRLTQYWVRESLADEQHVAARR